MWQGAAVGISREFQQLHCFATYLYLPNQHPDPRLPLLTYLTSPHLASPHPSDWQGLLLVNISTSTSVEFMCAPPGAGALMSWWAVFPISLPALPSMTFL